MKEHSENQQLTTLSSPSNSLRHFYPEPLNSPQPENEIDLRQLWTVLFRRKWQILLVTLSVLLPTAIVTYLATPLFRSAVTLEINADVVKVLPYRDATEAFVSPARDYERYVNSQQEIIMSPTFIRRTVRRLEEGLETPQFDDRNLRGLEVQPVPMSHMLYVSYSSPDPELSARVANVVAEEFIQMGFERGSEATRKAARFLEAQLAVTREKVERAEAELISYARDHEILNVDDDQIDLIRQKLDQLTTEVTRSETDHFNKRAQFETTEAISVEDFPESLKTPLITGLETQLFALKQELTQLEARFGKNWPEVVQKKQEIDLASENLKAEVEATITRVKKQVQMDFEASQKEYRMLFRALQSQEGLVNNLNDASIQFNILKREVATNEELYRGLLQRLKETGVTASLEFGNLHIISRAEPALRPYSPNVPRNLALALLLGLSLGTGLAFVMEYLDNTVKVPEELESLGLATLGLVPVIEGLNGRFLKLDSLFSAADKRKKAETPSGLLPPGQWQARESYYGLSTAVLLARAEAPPRRILITSASPQEGKTTTIAYLGATLAEMGASTVIVDADLRKPAISNLFGIEAKWGLSNFLAGHSGLHRDYIHQTAVPGLSILPSGPKTPNPIALLRSNRFEILMEALGRAFKFVLVDSSPILTVADSKMLVSNVDGVILVLQADKTPKEIIKRARRELDQAGAHVLGAVINRADLSQPEYAYYNQYYYDQSYSNLPSKPVS